MKSVSSKLCDLLSVALILQWQSWVSESYRGIYIVTKNFKLKYLVLLYLWVESKVKSWCYDANKGICTIMILWAGAWCDSLVAGVSAGCSPEEAFAKWETHHHLRPINADTHTHKHTQTRTQTQTNKQKTNKQTNKNIHTHKHKQRNKQTNIQPNKQTNKQTDRQTDRQTDKQTNKQTDKHSQSCGKYMPLGNLKVLPRGKNFTNIYF